MEDVKEKTLLSIAKIKIIETTKSGMYKLLTYSIKYCLLSLSQTNNDFIHDIIFDYKKVIIHYYSMALGIKNRAD